jgi:PTS system mannitol-specific IIC component
VASSVAAAEVKRIVFACEAGAGSSLLGAMKLQKRLRAEGLSGIAVEHHPVHALPRDAQVVICHENLGPLARERAPEAVVLCFRLFVDDRLFSALVADLVAGRDIEGTS